MNGLQASQHLHGDRRPCDDAGHDVHELRGALGERLKRPGQAHAVDGEEGRRRDRRDGGDDPSVGHYGNEPVRLDVE